MKKLLNKLKNIKFKHIMWFLTIVLCCLCAGISFKLKIAHDNLTATIEYIDETENTPTVEFGLGGVNIENIPTVEAVENNMPVTNFDDTEECPEGEECGRGSIAPIVSTKTPESFANDVLGRCLDVDNFAGSQCWDEMDVFFENYAKHPLYTCGTGAAKGTIADGCWQKNAGDDFVMIWDAKDLQPGDIAVFSTGQWGHIGMVMSEYNSGYFILLGQNQGGTPCPRGGSAGNLINISAKDFIGAFRPKDYIKPEPVTPDCGIVK